jgi:hypothetical protein
MKTFPANLSKHKPKFRRLQIVIVRKGFIRAGAIVQILGAPRRNKEGDWEYPIADISWAVEWALRPLTAQEMG